MDVPQEIRNIMVHHHEAGYSCRQIALMVNRPKSTVNNILKRYSQMGTSQATRFGKCGRKKILSERGLATFSTINPQATARQLRALVGGNVATASLTTVKDALRRQGKHARRPLKSPSLNASQRTTRLRWCQQYSAWDEEKWKKVSCHSPFESLFCMVYRLFFCLSVSHFISGHLLR
jgi:transposase